MHRGCRGWGLFVIHEKGMCGDCTCGVYPAGQLFTSFVPMRRSREELKSTMCLS